MNVEGNIVPPLKWAGGKRWLLKQVPDIAPKQYKKYIEPFAGGAAVFFALRPTHAILADLNTRLIEFYQVLQEFPSMLWKRMESHQEKHSEDYYYSERGKVYENRIDRAGQFLYLNKTCWNGLYRVNLLGQFNVPIGTKSTVILDSDDFQCVSRFLKGVEILCSDFESVIDGSKKGDFLFVDPPYTATHNFNNFIKYNERLFSWDDQCRLCDALVRAKNRGTKIALTNAMHPSVLELYSPLGEYVEIERQSVLSGNPKFRKRTAEALFLANYRIRVDR